jgi:hypothetical protein
MTDNKKDELIYTLCSKGGVLTGSRHPVLFNAGVKANDLDIIIPNSTELECQNWIKSVCCRFELTYKERSFYKGNVKVVDLIFIRGAVKSETYDGIECVSVNTLLRGYRSVEDSDDRAGKNDNIKVEILEKYLSQSKSLSRIKSPFPSPTHRLKKKPRTSKSLLFHSPEKSRTAKSLSFAGF